MGKAKHRRRREAFRAANAQMSRPDPVQAVPVRSPATGAGWQVSMETFQGPLPPPEVLSRYNAAFPGAAERIVAMAEHQALHRQQLEKLVVDGKQRNERFGQWVASIIGMVAILGSIWLLDRGKATEGFTVFGTLVTSLVASFIYGRVRQRQDLQKKADAFGPQNIRVP